MLFGFKKSKPKAEYIKYLNEADAEYIRAHVIKSTRILNEYLTPECIQKVSKSIYGGVSRYFGIDCFRNTTWEIISSTADRIDFRKSVVYDKVKVTSTLKMCAADNYRELWSLDTKSMKIFDIRTLA